MKLIYSNINGNILTAIPKDQHINTYFVHTPKEYRDDFREIVIEPYPINYTDYKVVDNELVLRDDLVIDYEPLPNPLEERIKELEDIIDVMLGGIEDGI